MCRMTLASRLFDLRKAKGLSQEALGEIVGITQQTVNAIEEGKTLHPRKIKQIAVALDTTPQYLLYAITGNADPFANLDPVTYELIMAAAQKISAPTLDPDIRENAMSALRVVAKQDVAEYESHGKNRK